jgi:TerC family integral membrane protein
VHVSIWGWLGTGALITALLLADLVVHRYDRGTSLRKSLIVSAGWVCVSVLFGVAVGVLSGSEKAEEYYAVYLTEKALSIDNVFVFAVVFSAFLIPMAYQRRVLFYGVFGALLFRAALIALGSSLLEQFAWILFVLGALLIVAGVRMLRGGELVDPSRNVATRLFRRVLPVTPAFVGQRFFARVNGRWMVTPLVTALLAIEVTDIVFAMDSIPASFGITGDVFVIFTANAFALLGLRSLYFVLAGTMDRLVYIHLGLAVLLVFIGCKMLFEPLVSIPILVSVALIVLVIGVAVGASIWRERRLPSAPIELRENAELRA